ncbi:hypothetical protein [Fulvivirga sediminis]|uniref:Uncharacterized protein n=1 Tax=Fulvivirga sediminis TaxID=2803949 RepID=A0A937F799_9BACT|nr:hypothetical protein [Fulvivirga sediminis]MBL3655293.1 hypothetical protein [Fulvivirga sediminis]
MRKFPKFIETTDREILDIDQYRKGRFKILTNNGLIIYDIHDGQFYKRVTSEKENKDVEVALEMKPRFPDLYRDWLASYRHRYPHEDN